MLTMPQSRHGSIVVKRSKRYREKVSPYHKEQGRIRKTGSPDFSSHHRPSSNQLEVIKCMLSNTWHLYHLSPLWMFSSDSSKLRNYSQQLTRYVQCQLTAQTTSMGVLHYVAKLASLPGFGMEDSETIEMSIRQRQSKRNAPELMALLCRINETQTILTKGFVSLPLLVVRGSARLTEIMIQWIQSTFDCHITPFNLTHEDLSALVSEYAPFDEAIQKRVSGKVELVYNLPESIRKAGLSTITIELPQDSAVALWEATGQEREESGRTTLFVKKLNEHIHTHFHLKLESTTLSRISTPVLHADSSGRLKFKSPYCVISVLSMLQSCMA